MAESPKPLAEFEDTSGGALAVTRDGKWLAVGADYKGPLELFKLVDRQRAATLESAEGTYVSVDFSPDGKLLAAVRVTLDPPENNLSIWNLATKKRLWETKEGVAWARFSPDGKQVAVGKFGLVRFFEPRTGRLLQNLPIGSEAYVGQGEYAAAAKLFVTSGDEDRRITLWNTVTGRVANSIKLEGDEISGLALSDDGVLVAAAQQGRISVYETRSGKLKWSNKPSEEAIRSIDFRPRSQQLAAAVQDGTARVWEGATGKELRVIKPEHGMVQAVRYTPDGAELIVGSSGATGVYAAYDRIESAVDRIWRSNAGSFSLEAKLIGKDGDSVYLLRKSDQKQIVVTLSRLSEADRSYVDAAMKRSAEPLRLSYGLVEHAWETGEEPFELGLTADVLSLLAEVAGDFSSPTTSVEVGIEGDQWRLAGKTEGAFAVAKSYTIENMQPQLFSDKVQTFSWSAGQPPVKMLRKDEGVCFLSGISGAFHGYGEEVRPSGEGRSRRRRILGT
jgi:WD40 repeat protein